MKAPSCIGYYEAGDDQCDGCQYGHFSKPCLMREQCRIIQKYRLKEKNRISDLLTGHPIEVVDKFIVHIKEGGSVDSFTHGKQSKRKIALRQKHNTQECWRLYRHFENQLAERFGAYRLKNRLCSESHNRVVFVEGTFYPIDRTSYRVTYVLWYCKTNFGHDKLICKIYFKPHSKTLDICIPIGLDTLKEQFSAVTINKLNATSIEHIEGALETTFRRLSYEGVGLTVSCLKKLVDRNIFKLPLRKL